MATPAKPQTASTAKNARGSVSTSSPSPTEDQPKPLSARTFWDSKTKGPSTPVSDAKPSKPESNVARMAKQMQTPAAEPPKPVAEPKKLDVKSLGFVAPLDAAAVPAQSAIAANAEPISPPPSAASVAPAAASTNAAGPSAPIDKADEAEPVEEFNWDTATADSFVAGPAPKTMDEIREEARQAAMKAKEAEKQSVPDVPLAMRFAIPPVLGELDLSGPGRTCTQYRRFRNAIVTAKGLRTDSSVTLFICPDVVYLANEMNPCDFMLIHQPYPRNQVYATEATGRHYTNGSFFKLLMGEGAKQEDFILMTSGPEETHYWLYQLRKQ